MGLAGGRRGVGSGEAGLPLNIALTLLFALQGERGEKGDRGDQVSWDGVTGWDCLEASLGQPPYILLLCRAETALLASLDLLAPRAPR